jgi:hypothetical protein
MIQTPPFISRLRMARRVHAGGQTDLPTTHRNLRLCVSLLVLLTAACDEGGSATPMTRPTAPPTSLLTYTGTLLPQSTNSYSVSVLQPGYVEATLVGLAAPPTTTVGLGIGNLSASGTCSLIYSVNTAPGPTAQIVGTGLSGTLCVAIYDIGNLTGPAIYTITVASS